MHTNTDITLYSVAANGNVTRLPILGKNGKKAVLWDEVKQSNILKSGLTNADSIKIMLPIDNLPDGITFNLTKDMVVKGVIGFELDNTSPQTRSASITALKSACSVYSINSADAKLYGSRGMQHYQLSCK